MADASMKVGRIARRRRAGMASVIVEVILIVVTLISVVIFSGFLFGTFTVYIPPAEVAAQVTSCSTAGMAEVCQLVLANQGARSVGTDGVCSMTLDGSRQTGQIQDGGVIPASGSLNGVACVVSGTTAPSGAEIVGALALTNGALVYFTGHSM